MSEPASTRDLASAAHEMAGLIFGPLGKPDGTPEQERLASSAFMFIMTGVNHLADLDATPESSRPKPKLTKREMEILQLAAGGQENKEIADHLGVEASTIARHFARIREKLKAKSDRHAIGIAIRHDIIY